MSLSRVSRLVSEKGGPCFQIFLPPKIEIFHCLKSNVHHTHHAYHHTSQRPHFNSGNELGQRRGEPTI